MNSIQREITGLTIANQVLLERASHKGCFLLVEGSSDSKLFQKFIDDSACSIVVCLGQERLIEAISVLNGARFLGALGFSDRDFLEQIGFPNIEGDIVFTDENDVEVLILCSQALNNICHEYGIKDKITAEIEGAGKELCELIFEQASYVGALRLLAQRNGLQLKFSDMNYKFRGNVSFEIDLTRTTENLIARSPHVQGLNVAEFSREATELALGVQPSKILCRGHDCVRILGRALRHRLGATNQFDSNKGTKDLEKVLRLSYEFSFFKSTGAFQKIRDWETQSGFSIFN